MICIMSSDIIICPTICKQWLHLETPNFWYPFVSKFEPNKILVQASTKLCLVIYIYIYENLSALIPCFFLVQITHATKRNDKQIS
jgi:hypothetical protein